MKVLNLQCTHQHGFEGWFDSELDYLAQVDSGLLSCPICGDACITKMPSAPRLNLRGQTAPASPAQDATAQAPEQGDSGSAPMLPMALQGQMLKALRQVMKQTEDVGEQFATEARAMHSGEVEQRNIRGRTSPDEAMALLEEGIDLMPLPDLAAIKETLQ